jgi:hypothetical protein
VVLERVDVEEDPAPGKKLVHLFTALSFDVVASELGNSQVPKSSVLQ